MASDRYLIGGAIVISIIIHLAAVPLYDKFIKQNKPKKAEPIEVSYIPPKEQPPVAPPPSPQQDPQPLVPLPPIPDYTDNTERDTTFDEKLTGAASGAEKNETPTDDKKVASLPKIKPKPAEKPKTAPIQDDTIDRAEPADEIDFKEIIPDNVTPDQQDMPLPNVAGLMDTKDIVERIANKEKEQPEGQDTASYNKFEGKYASYFAKFKNSVYQVWNYPAESVLKGETGVVQVSFSILKDGTIVNIKLLRTSGYPALDREVMRVLKNMRQTPLPSSYELDQLNIDDANFIYTIGRGWDIF